MKDKEERQRLVEAFMIRILPNCCAAINRRCNATIFLGVDDNGRVVGILFETFELVWKGCLKLN